jgi:hypothetical protein
MNTNHGGAYVAAGVGTAVTGRGAHIALIDDPFKDREEADSERRRDLVWDWYRSTLFTRLMPGGAIVLIQTRWHEDDLAGRLLAAETDWEVLDLPAIDADGKALWPEWYDEQALERIKATIGPASGRRSISRSLSPTRARSSSATGSRSGKRVRTGGRMLPCVTTARRTTRSRTAMAIIPSIASGASTRRARCTVSMGGAGKPPLTSGSSASWT